MTFSLDGFDLDRFVADTLAEDLGAGGDITSAAVIPADARFAGVMRSREAIVVAGLPIAGAFFAALDPDVEIETLAEDGLAPEAGDVACDRTRRRRPLWYGQRLRAVPAHAAQRRQAGQHADPE